jgi:hypothetical protein
MRVVGERFLVLRSFVPFVLWCLTRLSYTWPATICSAEENKV